MEVNPCGSGVVVTIESTGARSIRVIVRDSKGRRHTKFGELPRMALTHEVTLLFCPGRERVLSDSDIPRSATWTNSREGQCQDTR